MRAINLDYLKIMRKLVIYFLLLFCFQVVYAQHIEDSGIEHRNGSNYDGIDVSSYQQDIDWEAVSKDHNIKFAYVKATEGASYTSPHYIKNIRNARQHGVKVGSYHFMRTTSSIKSQFENFRRSVNRDEQDLVPMIDIEVKEPWNRKELMDSVAAFAQMIIDYYGCIPMIYASSSFYNNYLNPYFNKFPLFIARYSSTPPTLKYDAKYALWQFSSNGQVDGIDHRVDLCCFGPGASVKDFAFRRQRHHKTISELVIDAGGVANHEVEMQAPPQFKATKNDKKKKKDKDEEKEKDKKKQQDSEKDSKNQDNYKQKVANGIGYDQTQYPTRRIKRESTKIIDYRAITDSIENAKKLEKKNKKKNKDNDE